MDRSVPDGIRKLAVLEPLAVFSLLMLYIWKLRFTYHGFWLVILALLVASHAVRGEGPGELGFGGQAWRVCVRSYGPALACLAAAMLAGGTLLGTMRPLAFGQALEGWAIYLPWGVLQQYMLNGYFLRRFEASASPRAARAISAILFSAAHTPNWFLMVAAFPAGICCTGIYRRTRNLYFLGVAHATVGYLIYLVIPDFISHHLYIGPGWFLH
jgi:membrane protease YdiL (CAAX protease family)